jgi:hypothetical protein
MSAHANPDKFTYPVKDSLVIKGINLNGADGYAAHNIQ